MDMKVGTVTVSIGVCSRQAPTVTRANGNVRGAAYLASPQLQRVAFSSSTERVDLVPACSSPPTRCWDNLHFEARRGLEWLLVLGRAALCAAKDWSLVWQTWLGTGCLVGSPPAPPCLLLLNLLSSLLRCFEHASCFVKESILVFRQQGLEIKTLQKAGQ